MAELIDLDPIDANNTARWPENMLAAAVNNAARADEGMLGRWYRDISNYAISSGTAAAYALNSSRTITSLTSQTVITFKAHATNTASATFNLNGLGALPIKKFFNQNLAASDVQSGQIVWLAYDSTNNWWQMISQPSSGLAGADISARIVKVGSTMLWHASTAPAGWLECNGAAVPGAYTELIALIGATLPDYRGRFIRGWNHGASNDPDAATRTNISGTVTGDTVGSYQSGAVASHTHTGSVTVSGTAAAAGGHSHSVAGTSDTASAHTHALTGVTANVTGTASGTTANGGVDHTHAPGTLANDTHTGHLHTGTTDNGGVDHTHVQQGTFATDSQGAHTHTTAGVFTNGTASIVSAGGGPIGIFSTVTSSSNGAHTHSMTISGSTAGSSAYAHGHTFTAASGGAHTHAISGATDSASAYLHTHTFSGTIAGSGGLTGTADSGGSHSHTVTGTAAAVADHTHTVSGSGTFTTAATGGNETRPVNISPMVIILASPAEAAAGALGVNGLQYYWSTGTTDADPGSGFLRWNSATFSSVTQIYISETDGYGANNAAWVSSWDDSTSVILGTIVMSQVGAQQNNAIFQVNAVSTDAGAYQKLNVTPLSFNGSFTAGAGLSVQYMRNGDKGSVGATGSAGGGIAYIWDTGTTDTDPGSGKVRIDNAVPSLAANIYLSTTDSNSASETAWLDTWMAGSSSTSKGTIQLTKTASPGTFAQYSVTGVTSATGYRKLAVTYIGGAGSFSAADSMSLTFQAKGDIGTSGIDGGVRWKFEASTTMGLPTDGYIRLNNAVFGSTTQLAISVKNIETGTPSVLALLQSWGLSASGASTTTTNLGLFTIKKLSAPENFVTFTVNAVATDNTTWMQFPVTYRSGSGSFSAADTVSVQFARTGDKGATGSGSGDLLAANNLSDVSVAATAFNNIKQAGSTSATGVLQLATTSEAGTGTDTAKAVTAAGLYPAFADVASATSTLIGAAATDKVRITGTTTIAGFDTVAAGIRRNLRFAAALTLTHNGTSLILPGATNITTAANDECEAVSLGSGNWVVLWYQKATGKSVVTTVTSSDISAAVLAALAFGPFTSIASAASTDLSTVATIGANITGTTTITSFGAGTNLLRIVKFSGALTLTHNASALILPGASSITTAAGDTLIAMSDGSGNWTVVSYQKASGLPINPVLAQSTTAGRLARYSDTVGTQVATTGLYEDGTGNVGVGVTPATRLEASISSSQYWSAGAWSGSTTPTQAITATNSNPGGYDPVMLWRMATTTGTVKTAAGIGLAGRSSWTDGSVATQISDMYFVLRDGADALQERLRITYAGLFGFGTTSPSNKVSSEGIVAPETDNAYTLGTSGKRWTVVYATTGTINTSDARQKTDVTPSPLGLDFVKLLKPVTYKWIEGGSDVSFEDETYDVDEPVMLDFESTITTIDNIDGKFVERVTTHIEKRPVYDEHPLHDADGNQLHDADGNPRLHYVQRMQKVTRTRQGKKIETPRAGKRTHYGLLAQDVKAALDALSVSDFAGWVLEDKNNPDSPQGLRPDQFLPVLIRAIQELDAKISGTALAVPTPTAPTVAGVSMSDVMTQLELINEAKAYTVGADAGMFPLLAKRAAANGTSLDQVAQSVIDELAAVKSAN